MGNTSNCHFGGPDRKTLFITGDGGLYKVQLKIAGRVRPGAPTGVRLSKGRDIAFAKRAILRRQGPGRLVVEEVFGRLISMDGRNLSMDAIGD
jgi:hypothetical protein